MNYYYNLIGLYQTECKQVLGALKFTLNSTETVIEALQLTLIAYELRNN